MEILKEITCSRCKGKGVIFDPFECVVTGGVSFVLGLLDRSLRDKCPECNGTGTIYRKIIVK